MALIKMLLTMLVVCICSQSISACAAANHRGNGVVYSVKKIHERDFKPRDGAKNGASILGVAGAVVVGTVGAATGASLGYIVDVTQSDAAMYEYVVKPDNHPRPIIVTQYSSIIPVEASVSILEKDGQLYIKSNA